MITHRILECISKNIIDTQENKYEILQGIKILLKKKSNCVDAFFDIYKLVGNDIKKLYSSLAPYLFLYYSDNRCCSLIWKVDKYINNNNKTILVPSRCSKNRIDNSSLYCRTHNNPLTSQFCKLCSKNCDHNVYHAQKWEHFGNIFQFNLNLCFNDNNIENCYMQNYSKILDELICISYADFFIEQNKHKYIASEKPLQMNINIQDLKLSNFTKIDRDIIIKKNKTKMIDELSGQLRLPVINNLHINLDDEIRSILWSILLNYIFIKNPKAEKSISTITVFDKENIQLYTNDKIIYNSNFKTEGIILNDDIAVFKEDINNYVNSINISKISDSLIKVFIQELL